MIASSIGTNSAFPVYIYLLEDTLAEYSNVYIEIVKPIYDENGAVIEEKVTKLTTYTVSKNYYQGRNALRFTYSDINLYEMGVVFARNVYADGILITSSEYSIGEYVSKTIKNEKAPAVLKKMLVDIVNLGSAEQLKEGYLVDNLVNSVLTDEERAFGTVGTPSIVDNSILTRGEDDSIHIVGANIDLQKGVVANINFTIGNRNLDDFNIEISHTAYNGKKNVTLVDGATATKSGDVYSVAYSKLNFADLRKEIKIRFIDKATGETIGDQLTTSGESIMAQGFANGEDEATLNMYNALMIYSDSKCEYNDYVNSQK
jgi:hypothetical protein